MKQLLVFLLLLCAASVSAQDVIVKKDGSTVVCRVVELTATEITYKKWSDLNGSNYVMERSAASAINYENGKKVNLSEVENLYKPGNQNDGLQQYNDKALLLIDYANNNPYKKVKILQRTAIIGGAVCLAASIPFLAMYLNKDRAWYNDWTGNAALGCIGVGAIWTGGFLMAANYTKKKIDERLLDLSLYEFRYDFGNGSTLTPSVNILRDQACNNQAIGLGLRYNF